MTPRWLDRTPLWCQHGAMELGQYVSDLQRQLVDAAANGAEDTRAVAERLAAGLDAAARLVLLDALSAAVGEITPDLEPKQRRSAQRTLRTGDSFAGWAR